MLERLHGSDRSVGHRGDCFEREVGNEPQDHDLALIRSERVECRHEHRVEGFVGRRNDLRGLRTKEPPAALRTPPFVDQSAVRNREHPPPERVVIAVEPVNAAGDVEEHLAQEVLAVDGS